MASKKKQARQFVDLLVGKQFIFTRTCLLTGRFYDPLLVNPCRPQNTMDGATLEMKKTRYHYGNDDIFSSRDGKLYAIFKDETGNLFWDRFVISEAG